MRNFVILNMCEKQNDAHAHGDINVTTVRCFELCWMIEKLALFRWSFLPRPIDTHLPYLCQPSQPSLPVLSRGSAEASTTTGSVGASTTFTCPLYDPSVFSFSLFCSPILRLQRSDPAPPSSPHSAPQQSHVVQTTPITSLNRLCQFPQLSYGGAQRLGDKIVGD